MKRKNNIITRKTSLRAFTVVEVVITTAVVSIFILGFFQVYLLIESQRVMLAKRAYASSIAYTNLKKITTRPNGITMAQCNTYMDALTNKPGLDLTTIGYVLETDTDVRNVLGLNANQTLLAFAPYGCANLTTNAIRVMSTVTYGTQGDKVTHASFIK